MRCGLRRRGGTNQNDSGRRGCAADGGGGGSSSRGWLHTVTLSIPRGRYAELFGPTTGDRVRLADTDLIIEIESDLLAHGDEVVFGGGKSARDGLGQASDVRRDDSLDLLITNAVVMDPVLGIIKADIGIKDGLVAGVGNAGNPHIMDGIDMVVSSNTEVIAGEHTICTPGTIDTHIHFISPQQAR